jgi:hypothetical protein
MGIDKPIGKPYRFIHEKHLARPISPDLAKRIVE